MRVKIQQFLFGKNHSWSIVGQNLGRALLKLGHEVHFVSTDGFEDKYCPEDLRPHVRKTPVGTYDCQVSYTAPHNWPAYLSAGKKNRFGIWNYEYNNKRVDAGYAKTLLAGFAKYAKACDMVLPSSGFTREVFRSMKIPDERMVVVPHGINLEDFQGDDKVELQTKKKHKILWNIAQPHRRKAIPIALRAFGEAFKGTDDVCLVAKIFTKNKANHQFDVDFWAMYKTFEQKYPNHADVEFMTKFVPNIADLYRACDINYSATHAECWHLPSLEALAAGLINIVPRYGGQLEFCNDDNSLLIDGKVVRAPRDHQYWNFNPHAVHFQTDVKDAARMLRKSVDEFDDLKAKFAAGAKKTAEQFTWENAAKQIVELCK